MRERIGAALDRSSRKALLKEIGNRPSLEVAEELLPWLHDKSPRVTGRILAIFAHHKMDDQVGKELASVDKKRADHLMGRFKRFRQGEEIEDL